VSLLLTQQLVAPGKCMHLSVALAVLHSPALSHDSCQAQLCACHNKVPQGSSKPLCYLGMVLRNIALHCIALALQVTTNTVKHCMHFTTLHITYNGHPHSLQYRVGVGPCTYLPNLSSFLDSLGTNYPRYQVSRSNSKSR
jgi:hypothetical protein